MRVLILGYHGYGNAGDEALLGVEVAALRARLPAAHFAVLSGDPAATEALHRVRAFRRASPVAVARALRWCDVLVAGGGSLLQDVTSSRPVLFYGGLMLAAARAGKVVVSYAQGLGPLRSRLARTVAGRALRAVHYLSLRDAASVALAERLGAPGAEAVADPVLALRPAVPASSARAWGCDRGNPSGRRRVAVAVRPWGTDPRWQQTLVDVLAELADQVEPVLVPMQPGRDVELAERLAGRLAARTGRRPELVIPDGGYRQTVAALQAADVVLGMRLHALIAGAAAALPVVPISYDPKVDAFAAQLGVPVACDVATLGTPAGGPRLQQAVLRVLGWEAGDHRRYRDTVAELARLAELPAQRTAELLGARSSVEPFCP